MKSNYLKQRQTWFLALLMFLLFAALASGQFHSILLEKSKGFSPSQIGTLLMTRASTYIVSPFLVLWLGKWVKNPNHLLSFSLLAGALGLYLFSLAESFGTTLLTIFFMQIALSSSATLSLTSILMHTRPIGNGAFLFLRSIGTLGWACAGAISMWISMYTSETSDLYYFFAASGVAAFILSWYAPASIPESKVKGSFIKQFSLLKESPTLAILLILTLANGVTGSGVDLIGNYIHNDLQMDNSFVGLSWVIATLPEIFFMWLVAPAIKRFGLKSIIATGIFASGLRLILSGLLVENPTLFLPVQALHGVFYATVLTGYSIYLRERYPPDQIHSVTMSSSLLYNGIALSVAGKLFAQLWEYQGLQQVFFITGGLNVAAGLLLILFIKIPSTPNKIKASS